MRATLATMADPKCTVREVLQCTDVFGLLSPKALDALVAAAREARPRAGASVWRWGEKGKEAAVVLEGSLEICRPSPRGSAVLRTVGPGSVVGLSSLAGEPHTADVVAGPGCRLALLPNSALRALLRGSPEVAVRIIASLGELVGRLTDELGQARDADLMTRVSRFLLREASDGVVARTHATIATSVGATRARVSRALAAWQGRGAVRCDRARVVLLRPEVLGRP